MSSIFFELKFRTEYILLELFYRKGDVLDRFTNRPYSVAWVGATAQPWSLFIHESPLALRIVRVLGA